MKLTTKYLMMMAVLFATVCGSIALAQEADDNSGDADCQPASLETPYDKMKVDSISQQQVTIWYSLAHENYKYKQWSKAIPYYWKVIVSDKSGKYEKFAYVKLMECYKNLGKSAENGQAYIDSSLIVLYRGLKRYPNNPTIHFHLGNLQRGLGNSECALPHFQKLVELYPDKVEYLKNLVDIYLDLEDERAIEAQKKVTEMDGSLEEQMKYKTVLERFGKDPMKAVVESFETDSTNLQVCINLANEALQRGNYPLVLRGAKAGLKLDPKNINLLDAMAKAYEGLGNYSEAISAYRKIIDADPKNINAYCSLALAYASVKNFAAAKSQINRATSIDPSNGLPYITMGQIIEEAIDYCSGKRGKNEYDYVDNLVFEIAARYYEKAKRDPNYAASAENRIRALRPFFRSQEQKFLRQNSTEIKDSCYSSWLSY